MADETPLTVEQAIDALVSRFAPLTMGYAEFCTAVDKLIAAVRAENAQEARIKSMIVCACGVPTWEGEMCASCGRMHTGPALNRS